MTLPDYPPGRILRREEAAPWVDGFSFLEAARAQAQRLRTEAEQTYEQARLEGRRQGLDEGRQAAVEALARRQAELDRWQAAAEPALAELALNIARQLIGELSPGERLLALTRQALTDFRQDQALVLQLAPGEAEAARLPLAEAGLSLTVDADPSLSPGQARLGRGQGAVELGVEAQLAQVRRALLPHTDVPLAP